MFSRLNAAATLNQIWEANSNRREFCSNEFQTMNAVNALTFLRKSFSTKARTVLLSLKNVQRNASESKHTTSFGRSHIEGDVVLFKYENPKFFCLINLASGIQCAFWTYLGVFLFQSIKTSDLDLRKKEFWNTILEKERKYSDLLSGVALFFGWSMLFATVFYSLRSVRKIILHKGGRSLTIVTYSLPGHNVIKVPLSNVSSSEHRIKAKKFIPMKVKNKYFYYLLDVKGEFSNPELFDTTAGINRNF